VTAGNGDLRKRKRFRIRLKRRTQENASTKGRRKRVGGTEPEFLETEREGAPSARKTSDFGRASASVEKSWLNRTGGINQR